MSLTVYLTETRPVEVYVNNITHNVGVMAREAGVYDALWSPENLGVKTARDLMPHLEAGLKTLWKDPPKFKAHNPENGWGDYDGLCEFVREYLTACIANPDAAVQVSR